MRRATVTSGLAVDRLRKEIEQLKPARLKREMKRQKHGLAYRLRANEQFMLKAEGSNMAETVQGRWGGLQRSLVEIQVRGVGRGIPASGHFRAACRETWENRGERLHDLSGLQCRTRHPGWADRTYPTPPVTAVRLPQSHRFSAKSVCAASSRSPSWHIQRMHTTDGGNERKFPCTAGDKKFFSLAALKSHERYFVNLFSFWWIFFCRY